MGSHRRNIRGNYAIQRGRYSGEFDIYPDKTEFLYGFLSNIPLKRFRVFPVGGFGFLLLGLV